MNNGHFPTEDRRSILDDEDISDPSIGRIVSVTGSKAIVLLDSSDHGLELAPSDRPEMGTLLAISLPNTTVLAIVSALSVPVPAHSDGEHEIWIAELGLVGELAHSHTSHSSHFNRGVSTYPSLGDRVRIASKQELRIAFMGATDGAVRVGSIRQDSSIPAMIRVDDLLGKHFAILGTTGTGKSCTTALILRAILDDNPNAHIVLLDPHNEYATAFGDWAEVISPRTLQLPYWLLNFEELTEVIIGDPTGRKAEIETLQELIPIAKARYTSARKESSSARRSPENSGRFSVDTPVPYRMSDVLALIDERMGKLENKNDLQPYKQLRHRIEAISRDARYSFMFGNVTVYDSMAQILGRLFRVPVKDRPITILELTGLPTEIINVVVSVLCRMTFDFALWSEGEIPVTLVCEEAHRYAPVNNESGFEPTKRAIAKIAKEGRKYGASLCIVTQRPAEIDPTILSQCNTVFALRMSNDRDQQIVQSAVSDTGSGLLEFLPALGQREAIAFGDGVAVPVRIQFDELAPECLPRSSTARFSEKWQSSIGDDNFLNYVVERWRSSGSAADGEAKMANIADAIDVGDNAPPARPEPAVAAGSGPGSRRRPNADSRVDRSHAEPPPQQPPQERRPMRRSPAPEMALPQVAHAAAEPDYGNARVSVASANDIRYDAGEREPSQPRARAPRPQGASAAQQPQPAAPPNGYAPVSEIPRAPRTGQGGVPRANRGGEARPASAAPPPPAAYMDQRVPRPERSPAGKSGALQSLRDKLRQR